MLLLWGACRSVASTSGGALALVHACGRPLAPLLRRCAGRPFSASAPSLRAARPARNAADAELEALRAAVASMERARHVNSACYVVGMAVLATGVSFAAVPLYRAFCQATGFGGTTQRAEDVEKIATMTTRTDRLIRIKFMADTHAAMRWQFQPMQPEIWVHPGETALAFYSAQNDTAKPVVGISTYNIVPFDAGSYFAKIQCFCFEEQILNSGEQVDMPVFFYIDPDFAEDPKMELVNEITLSYTFFESKDGLGAVDLPRPHFAPAPEHRLAA